MEIEKHLAGEQSKPPIKRYRDATDRLKSIAEDYANRPIVEYLTAIAHNLTLNV